MTVYQFLWLGESVLVTYTYGEAGASAEAGQQFQAGAADDTVKLLDALMYREPDWN